MWIIPLNVKIAYILCRFMGRYIMPFLSGCVFWQSCDSLYEHDTSETSKQPKILYAEAHDEQGKVPVQRQSVAIAFAADLLHDFSVARSRFVHSS